MTTLFKQKSINRRECTTICIQYLFLLDKLNKITKII